ncbi:DUF2490 domain-containing protein [Chryseolinea sp. T2]|uniref:DUF2490 domain-containing protein n=1 Tax=Chryseolinea sp. T2 TaxID=3129255 RepID=UPI00307869A4
MKCRLLLIWFVVICPSAMSQSRNGQLWAEYMLNYAFANSFNLENTISYSTAFTTPKWRSFEYSPTLDYSVLNWLTLTAAATMTFTAQTEDYNTFELRPAIGTRIHITPNQRVLLRTYLRVEQRNLKNLDTKEWETSYRPRVRLESIIPINRKSYYEDRLWYGIVDVELLYTTNDVKERFANRFRIRTGVGYRLNAGSRFELIYMLQESRNGINEAFTSVDNIIRVRYRQFLRVQKKHIEGTGN